MPHHVIAIGGLLAAAGTFVVGGSADVGSGYTVGPVVTQGGHDARLCPALRMGSR